MQIKDVVLLLSIAAACSGVSADEPPASAEAYLQQLDEYPHLEQVEHAPARPVRDYLVPLGAIEKIRGQWSPRDSQRYTGTVSGYTWRVLDGYDSAEIVADMERLLGEDPRAALLFGCDARACGSSVQWANRIFGQRVLYGTERSQRYRVYTFEARDSTRILMLYGSARTTDRQYLHAEILVIAAD